MSHPPHAGPHPRRVWLAPKLVALALGLALSLLGADASGLPTAPSARAPAPAVVPNNLVVLLTDFGERGYHLGALKGAIYGGAPGVRVDSISNEIERFDVQEASYVLSLAVDAWPRGTVFVGLVNPDGSGPRPPIIATTRAGHTFVVPDNGLLTQVVLRHGLDQAWSIEQNEWVKVDPRRAAFTSRDVFGPAAAALARGVPPSAMGQPLDALYLLTAPPALVDKGQVRGTVTLIDTFGNVMTNVQGEQLGALQLDIGAALDVWVGERQIRVTWVESYGDVRLLEPLATLNGHGEIKLALNQGDLAGREGIRRGDPIVIRPAAP